MIEFFILIGLSIYLIIKAVYKQEQDKQLKAEREEFHRQYQRKADWYQNITNLGMETQLEAELSNKNKDGRFEPYRASIRRCFTEILRGKTEQDLKTCYSDFYDIFAKRDDPVDAFKRYWAEQSKDVGFTAQIVLATRGFLHTRVVGQCDAAYPSSSPPSKDVVFWAKAPQPWSQLDLWVRDWCIKEVNRHGKRVRFAPYDGTHPAHWVMDEFTPGYQSR